MMRRFYDRKCLGPEGHTFIDCYEPTDAPVVKCAHCGWITERVWLQKSTSIVSDECNIMMTNLLCHEDGSPKRYTSKADIARDAKAKGYVSHVEHIGTKDGDRSKHTTRWI